MTNLAQYDESFDVLVQRTLATVSKNSRRVYQNTYGAWVDWCHNNGNDFLNINAGTVETFLRGEPVGKASRNRMLSAMRKMAKMLAALDYTNPSRQAAYKTLTMIVAPDTDEGSERDKVALTPEQIQAVLRAWPGDSLLAIRNRALIATLLYTGVRRAELGALRWSDINLRDGTIHIWHGKGDKYRIVAIVDDYAIDCLWDWYECLSGRYVYAFPHFENDKTLTDAPITGDGVYHVVRETSKRSGIKFSPHDLRRTMATNGLAENTPIADMKAQLGHADEATTLRYAQPADAQRRRKTIKLGY